MAIDLILMASSADRSGADVAIPIAVNETHVTGNGVPGTGTQWYPKMNGSIKGAFVNSETAAMVECRFHRTTDIDYNKIVGTHLQTDPVRTQSVSYLDYPIAIGDAIEASGENAGSVLDVLGLYVAKNASDKAPTPFPVGALPPGARLVRAVGATTLTVDAVSRGVITFDDFVPVRDQVYNIIGMAMNGATAMASRLVFTEGPNINDVPGVIASDTSTGLEYMMWYGDFGSFKGQTPPLHETISTTADTAQEFFFLIVPQGSKR